MKDKTGPRIRGDLSEKLSERARANKRSDKMELEVILEREFGVNVPTGPLRTYNDLTDPLHPIIPVILPTDKYAHTIVSTTTGNIVEGMYNKEFLEHGL